MVKRFFIFLETCFLLLFPFAVYADVILDPFVEVDIPQSGPSVSLLTIILVTVLISATAVIGTKAANKVK